MGELVVCAKFETAMLVEPSKCCRRHGLHISALTCGANPGSAVTPDYVGPFTFTGTLHSVTIDVSGDLNHDSEAELRVHLARQ